MSTPAIPSVTSRRISRSNSTSSSITTTRNAASRQGHRTSFQHTRPTSSDSIEQHFETLDAAVENRPVEDLKQVRHNLKRVSHSTRTSLSGAESSLLRSLRPTREMRPEAQIPRPVILASQLAANSTDTTSSASTQQRSPSRSKTPQHNSQLPTPRKRFGSQDVTPNDPAHNPSPDPHADAARSMNKEAPSSVAVVDHQRGVNKLGQNVSAIALQYTTATARPRTSRENKLGTGVYQATNSSHISLQQRPTHSRQRRDRSTNGSKDTTNGGSVSSLQSEQSRGRGHRSPAQKEMLSQALSKANIAVELDNAQNIQGAIQAYVEACDILDLVMRQSHDKDDKRKLSAIRTTYSNRIAELYDLDPSFDHLKNKDLPDSPRMLGHASLAEEEDDEAYDLEIARITARIADEQKPTLQLPPRQESLLPQIFGGAEYMDRASAPLRPLSSKENLGLPMDTRYAPPPLSPRRPLSPYDDDQKTPVVASHPMDALQLRDTSNNTSWLCTVDENASSGRSSRVSSTGYDAQDEQLVSAIEAEFDAMNAAVDAAYEADMASDADAPPADATGRAPVASTKPSFADRSAARTLSAQVSISTLDSYNTDVRYDPLTGDYMDDTARDEEDMLDHILHDGNALEPRPTVMSALPRQSDSSGFSARSSGRTWDSALTSNTNATATTSHTTLSTLVEGPERSPSPGAEKAVKTSDHLSNADIAASRQLAPLPPLPASEKNLGLRDRRVSAPSAQQLTIEISPEQQTRQLHEQQLHILSLDVSPWQPPPDPPRSATGIDTSTTMLSLTSARPATSGEPNTDPSTSSELVKMASHDGSTSTEKVIKPLSRQSTLDSNLRGKKLSLTTNDLSEVPLILGSANYLPKSSAGTSSAVSPLISSAVTSTAGGGMYLFDPITRSSSRYQGTASNNEPLPLEACPESFLLRPFWLMRTLYQALAHPRGGWLTNKLFVPRDIWRARNVKLKALDDKIAQLDLLTAALLKLAKVDTLDADAVWEELQSFETIIEQARIALQKKLGSDVGLSGPSGMFKTAGGVDEPEAKSTSKSFASSWRKLRSKPSTTVLTPSYPVKQSAAQLTLPSLPMTSASIVSTSRSYKYQRQPPPTPTGLQHIPYHNALYMASLARMFDAAQVLDSIARQVEDPGLKATNKTQVGLEISMRNAAEFFAFFIIRFVLADIGLLIDKYLKRGGEWVMT